MVEHVTCEAIARGYTPDGPELSESVAGSGATTTPSST
jgi:hypothetical protein